MSRHEDLTKLALVLAANAKPHKQTLHKRMNAGAENALEDARTIMRNAATIERWAVLECNGVERWDVGCGKFLQSWTEKDQENADKATNRAIERIKSVVQDYKTVADLEGINGKKACAEFGGDPRGSLVKISFKTGTWYY